MSKKYIDILPVFDGVYNVAESFAEIYRYYGMYNCAKTTFYCSFYFKYPNELHKTYYNKAVLAKHTSQDQV